jgi:hypothetical protein
LRLRLSSSNKKDFLLKLLSKKKKMPKYWLRENSRHKSKLKGFKKKKKNR